MHCLVTAGMAQPTTVLFWQWHILIKVPSVDEMYNYVAIFRNVLVSLKYVHVTLLEQSIRMYRVCSVEAVF